MPVVAAGHRHRDLSRSPGHDVEALDAVHAEFGAAALDVGGRRLGEEGTPDRAEDGRRPLTTRAR
jgi:hypothetical protein